MNIKLIKLLTVLCILLLAGIAGEWLYAKRVHQQTLAALKVTDKKTPQIAQMPTIALTKKPEQSFADMVNRPLFIKGRRPVPELPVDPKLAIAKPSGPFNWQLNGIYTKGKSLYALLSRSVRVPKGNFKRLSKGTDIDGWTLAEVQKDKVILNQNGMQKELLLRKPKPKTPKINNAADPNNPNNPKTAEEQAQGQGQVVPPNQPMMAEPLPNGEPMQGAEAEIIPEAEPMPGAEEEVIPEPEPEFQTDEFSQDTSTFDNGTNEQF
ncbi:conserved hypothetical protein [Crenothrix polyspora]|uniref:Type II secretion system protein GspC N-terminal domain-containing protein n=1 Tax=Crenothrix polyspora TaxID=360316 RepID=A0A1R4H9Q0_9GAMM|nr:hypothetical protein [Crenothrix polyspora]SJM92897.1 conserved hypothetical protein [Crenothrix polyspora]